MNKVLTALLFFSASIAFGQDFYVKSYPSNPVVFGHAYNISVESFPDGSYVVSGHINSSNTIGRVFVRMFNKCGNEIWHKQISDSIKQMDLVGLNIDSNQNIIITGLHDISNQSPKPYLIKLDKNGNVIFSKMLGSVNGYNHLIYATSVAANGDYVIYGMHRYTTSPPNNQKLSICRLTNNGVIKWAKNYEFGIRSWGRLTATRDNGALAFTGNTLYKTDSLGNIEWAKQFSSIGYLYAPIETDSSYIFGRYRIGAIDRGSFFEINKDGSLGWTTDNFMNFYPEGQGTLLQNGNVMYAGSNRLTGGGLAIVEVDSKTGNTVFQRQLNGAAVASGIIPFNLTETSDSAIVFVGQDNRGILQQLVVGKIDRNSGTIACGMNTITSQQDPFSITEIGNDAAVVSINTDYTSVSRTFNDSALSISSVAADCEYTAQRGNYNLGNDTVLCFGQSIQLGDLNSNFDSYLWSTGSTNKTIATNQGGTYWLQVVSACDTLKDTIKVSYQPGILFTLGPDTISCRDSLVLGAGLNGNISYTWSTGETTKTITVKNSGTYWVEHSNKCNSTRDSIQVYFQPVLPEINIGNDTTLCPGDGIDIGVSNSNFTTFEWSTGGNNPTISVFNPGTYWLQASNACQVSVDTVVVSYYDKLQFNIGTDTSLCEGENVVLGSSLPLNNCLWSTGATTPFIVVSDAGIYWLESQTNCGTHRDSVSVTIKDKLIQPQLIEDTSICKGTSIELESGLLSNYTWSTKSTDSVIQVLDSGLYWLETKNRCDTLRDSVKISFYPLLTFDYTVSQIQAQSGDSISFVNTTKNALNPIWQFGDRSSFKGDSITYAYQRTGAYNGYLQLESFFGCIEQNSFSIQINPSNYHIPTVFTPNGDGINDLFLPVGVDIKRYSTNIYSNWGIQIQPISYGPWDGNTKNGKAASTGAYFYIIELEFYNGETKTFTGQVNLLR